MEKTKQVSVRADLEKTGKVFSTERAYELIRNAAVFIACVAGAARLADYISLGDIKSEAIKFILGALVGALISLGVSKERNRD
jgi:hypothetical protein